MGMNVGLNDGVDDDLVDDPLVTLPNQTPSGPEQVTKIITPVGSITDQGEVTGAELFKQAVPAGELPNFDAKIALIEEGVAKIVDLKEVEQQILGENQISQESAATYDSLLEGKLFETFPKYLYSKKPSKVNYGETVGLVRYQISQEALNVNAYAQEFMKEPLEVAKQIYESISVQCRQLLENLLDDISYRYRDLIEKLDDQPNLSVIWKGDILNLAKVMITSVPLDDFKIDYQTEKFSNYKQTPEFGQLRQAMITLQEILKCPYFKAYLSHVADHTPIPYADLKTTFTAYGEGREFSLMELIQLFKEDRLMGQADDLIAVMKEAYHDLDDLRKDYEMKQGEGFDPLMFFVVERYEKINQATGVLTHGYDFIKHLFAFLASMRIVFSLVEAIQ